MGRCRVGLVTRLGVLASGTGSILQAIVDAGLPVALVLTDRRCGAVEIAAQAGVPVEVVERTDFTKAFDRDAYTRTVVEVLKRHEIELVAMAGFGTVIPGIWDAYPDRVLNTHPALLPAFKGWHPVRDALAYGVKVTGCTVHFATPEMDAGPILAQEAVPVLADDTEQTLHERIKQVERRLYPETIRKVMQA
ncbi:MAG: phosphoribosylglycinamide formyltransferase [Actinobacteria bacterium]|nr:phosphoribosylglycinamide formyltransferase [Actinomycetota bacterium]